MRYEQGLKISKSSKLILFALLFPLIAFPDEPEKYPGAKASGLSNSTIALADPWSVFNNQAGLGWQRNYWVGVFHEKRYFVNELSYTSLGGCIPAKPGVFGVGVTHYGYSQFSQSRFGLSYGMMLSETISAGIGMNYHMVRFAGEYGGSECITAEGGIIYQPLERIAIGAHVFNPTGASIGSDQNLPTTFGLGLAYRPVESVLVLVQGDDNTLTSPVVRTGVEYSPVKRLSFRAGMSSNPMSLSFGLGWIVKSISFDLAFSYHRVLGYTPYLSVSYAFESNAENRDDLKQ
ncbi:MAG: hypothetical protein EHM93_19115 [Bacteroidales bacterium]|nr:MAG: hypothetical protein EHM93_19115 [Bacteroidales bacterium]